MNNEKTNNKKTNSKQQSKKKASSSAVIVVFITLIIAIASGNSEAAIAGDELENGISENLSPPMAAENEANLRHWNIPETKQEFWDLAELKNAYVNAAPAFLDDGISVGKLDDEGRNKTVILDLAREIANNEHAEVDSLLIAHNGKMVFESYYARGRINLSHPQSSATKAYTALLVGRAIKLGYLSLEDLDKPVVSLLKGVDRSKLAKGAETITLHDALTMSSGLEISKETVAEYRGNLDKYYGIAQVQAYFADTAPIVESAKTFSYQSFNPIIVMNVLSTVVPGSVESFAKNELFHKMNITNYDWRTREVGMLTAESGSSITSRNMLKIGTLIMNKGRWGNEQLIPKSYIKRMVGKHTASLTEEQVFSSGNKILKTAYGYFWWQTDIKVGEKVYSSNSAQGAGGNTILVIEELGVVVVVTGHATQSYLQIITEKVLPTFI